MKGTSGSIPTGAVCFRTIPVARSGSVRSAIFYIVKSGKVAVRRSGEELGTFGPNDEFGEMAALSTKPRIADAIALEDTVCYTLAGDDFRELLRAEPELAIELAATFAKRLAPE